MSTFEKTNKNTVVRAPKRGHYDQETIYPIIDEALICHVGFTQNKQPFVIPTLHARQGDCILLHGATTSRLISHIQAGNEVCITITLVDGLVLAEISFPSLYELSLGGFIWPGRLVSGDEEKLRAMELFTESILPGRWAETRQPNEQELKATAIVSIPIDSASAKVRTGPPIDDEADYHLPVWAGVLPIRQQVGLPENDPDMGPDIPLSESVKNYTHEKNERNEKREG